MLNPEVADYSRKDIVSDMIELAVADQLDDEIALPTDILEELRHYYTAAFGSAQHMSRFAYLNQGKKAKADAVAACAISSASMKNAFGLHVLGYLFLTGTCIRIPKNEAAAFRCFKRELNLDEKYACYYVGMCYELGYGCAINVKTAVEYYKRAMEVNANEAPFRRLCAYYKKNLMFEELYDLCKEGSIAYLRWESSVEHLACCYQMGRYMRHVLYAPSIRKMGAVNAVKQDSMHYYTPFFLGADDEVSLHIYNIAIMGDTGAGKTMMVRRLEGVKYGYGDKRTKLVDSRIIDFDLYDEGSAWHRADLKVNGKSKESNFSSSSNSISNAMETDSSVPTGPPTSTLTLSVPSDDPSPHTANMEDTGSESMQGFEFANLPHACLRVSSWSNSILNACASLRVYDIGGEKCYSAYWEYILQTFPLMLGVIVLDGHLSLEEMQRKFGEWKDRCSADTPISIVITRAKLFQAKEQETIKKSLLGYGAKDPVYFMELVDEKCDATEREVSRLRKRIMDLALQRNLTFSVKHFHRIESIIEKVNSNKKYYVISDFLEIEKELKSVAKCVHLSDAELAVLSVSFRKLCLTFIYDPEQAFVDDTRKLHDIVTRMKEPLYKFTDEDLSDMGSEVLRNKLKKVKKKEEFDELMLERDIVTACVSSLYDNGGQSSALDIKSDFNMIISQYFLEEDCHVVWKVVESVAQVLLCKSSGSEIAVNGGLMKLLRSSLEPERGADDPRVLKDAALADRFSELCLSFICDPEQAFVDDTSKLHGIVKRMKTPLYKLTDEDLSDLGSEVLRNKLKKLKNEEEFDELMLERKNVAERAGSLYDNGGQSSALDIKKFIFDFNSVVSDYFLKEDCRVVWMVVESIAQVLLCKLFGSEIAVNGDLKKCMRSLLEWEGESRLEEGADYTKDLEVAECVYLSDAELAVLCERFSRLCLTSIHDHGYAFEDETRKLYDISERMQMQAKLYQFTDEDVSDLDSEVLRNKLKEVKNIEEFDELMIVTACATVLYHNGAQSSVLYLKKRKKSLSNIISQYFLKNPGFVVWKVVEIVAKVLENDSSLSDYTRNLEDAVKSGRLCELHTHLLGMGSHEFWVEWVMCSFIPNIVRQHENIIKRCYDITSVKTAYLENFRNRLHVTGKKDCASDLQLPGICKSWMNAMLKLSILTVDVVYDKDNLLLAFMGRSGSDGNELDGSEDMLNLEKYLSNCDPKKAGHSNAFRSVFRDYLIYSAKDKKFKRVTGITNTDLLKAMEWEKRSGERSARAKAIIAKVRNCFSMLNPDGSNATGGDLDGYRGNFTPCFYPMRYALKDCLYHQYPIVISYLLNNVCTRYMKAGVGYVEFSVGVNDLSNPNINRFLHPEVALVGTAQQANPFIELADGWINYSKNDVALLDANASRCSSDSVNMKKKLKFVYKFLAGVPRNKTVVGKLSNAARRHFVILYGPLYTRIPRTTTSHDAFIDWLYTREYVSGLAEKLENIAKSTPQLCVGLDILSDENGNPFSPFLHSKVVEVVKKFQENNKYFGIRFHGGENVFRGSCVQDEHYDRMRLNFAAHMSVICYEMQTLHKEIVYESGRCNIRIGHGLAFTESKVASSALYSLNESDELYKKLELKLPNLDILNNRCMFRLQPETNAPHWQPVQQNMEAVQEWLRKNKIVFELNMTSNHTLMTDMFCLPIGTSNNRMVLYYLLQERGFSVRLSTDNDGIWPIHKCKRHNRHISVAFEYCKALRFLEKELDINYFKPLMDLLSEENGNYMHGWFWRPGTN